MPYQQAIKYELLRKHDFTVIPLADKWFSRFGDSSTMQTSIINDAFRHLEEVIHLKENQVALPMYKELARTVLVALDEIFPKHMSNFELKSLVKPEPSDAELLDVLDGLEHQGFINGKSLYDSQAGIRRLAVILGIRITTKGQEEISATPPVSAAVIQNYINNGHAGAMGPHSVGTINSRPSAGYFRQQHKVGNALVVEKITPIH